MCFDPTPWGWAASKWSNWSPPRQWRDFGRDNNAPQVRGQAAPFAYDMAMEEGFSPSDVWREWDTGNGCDDHAAQPDCASCCLWAMAAFMISAKME